MQMRSKDPKFKDRRVRIEVHYQTERDTSITIEDEGRGFDVSKVIGDDSTEPDMFDSFGRGMKMVKATAEGLVYNEKGNKVVMRYAPRKE